MPLRDIDNVLPFLLSLLLVMQREVGRASRPSQGAGGCGDRLYNFGPVSLTTRDSISAHRRGARFVVFLQVAVRGG